MEQSGAASTVVVETAVQQLHKLEHDAPQRLVTQTMQLWRTRQRQPINYMKIEPLSTCKSQKQTLHLQGTAISTGRQMSETIE